MAALAEVLPQVLDRALVLEDARQQLGEQLRQQRVGLAHQVGLEHLHRRPPVLKLLLAHAVARREEPPRRRRRRAPRRVRELLRQPAAVLIERRLRDVAHHVRHVVAAHVERVEADHRARQRGEGDVDVDLQRLAAARVDEEVLALLDGEEVGELDARQQHDKHRAHERDDRAGQRALPKLLERLRVDVEEGRPVRAQEARSLSRKERKRERRKRTARRRCSSRAAAGPLGGCGRGPAQLSVLPCNACSARRAATLAPRSPPPQRGLRGRRRSPGRARAGPVAINLD